MTVKQKQKHFVIALSLEMLKCSDLNQWLPGASSKIKAQTIVPKIITKYSTKVYWKSQEFKTQK